LVKNTQDFLSQLNNGGLNFLLINNGCRQDKMQGVVIRASILRMAEVLTTAGYLKTVVFFSSPPADGRLGGIVVIKGAFFC
jgi:hypothetical protein